MFPVSSWTLYDERACVPGALATQVILNDADVLPYVEQFEQLAPLAVFGDRACEVVSRAADQDAVAEYEARATTAAFPLAMPTSGNASCRRWSTRPPAIGGSRAGRLLP